MTPTSTLPRPTRTTTAKSAAPKTGARGDALSQALAERDAARAELSALRDGIGRIITVCEQTAQGDLEPRVLGIPRDSALGPLARAINQLLDLTDAFVRESRASLQHASQELYWRRVLERGLPGSYRGAARLINDSTTLMAAKTQQLRDARTHRLRLADEFELAIKAVADSVAAAATEARATAVTLSDTANHTTERSTMVAAAAEQTSRSMEVVAAASEEISATVSQISIQSLDSRTVAEQTVLAADNATKVMHDLSDASSQISRVVKLITEIASQTRLLALNANIEAARAGELGRGFAVVASEVKTLATRTRDATGEIEQRVNDIQRATNDAVESIGTITSAIVRVRDTSTAVNESVQQQRVATDEITRNIHEAATGSRDVTQNISMVSQSAADTSIAAGDLSSASGELSTMAERLQLEVQKFLDAVRADG